MTVLTSSSTFTIIGQEPTVASADIVVLPLDSSAIGVGSLIHPVLGTLIYPHQPDEWTGIDTDVIIPPSWGYAQTLGGGANTLHPGSMKDVVCVERWISDVSMPIAFLRTLLNFWMYPPDPSAGYLIWQPGYINEFLYHVILSEVLINEQPITLDYISRQGWVAGALSVKYRMIGYA